MKLLGLVLKYFLRGLLVTAPLAITLWILWKIFEGVDRLVPLPESVAPGVGFLLVIAVVVAVGVLTSNLLAAQAIALSDRLLGRVPFVKLVYTSLKDLTEAFVGHKKRFDHPVVLSVAEGISMIGFVTCEDLSDFALEGQVAVYLPQSYNFAANFVVVPKERVRKLDKPAGEVMAFVVSGGLTAGQG